MCCTMRLSLHWVYFVMFNFKPASPNQETIKINTKTKHWQMFRWRRKKIQWLLPLRFLPSRSPHRPFVSKRLSSSRSWRTKRKSTGLWGIFGFFFLAAVIARTTSVLVATVTAIKWFISYSINVLFKKSITIA